MTGDAPTAEEALAPGHFVDSDHADVRAFTDAILGQARDPQEKIRLLFAAVRDHLRYDPYSVTADPADYRASAILSAGPTWCVPKAVLLTACLRAASIPAMLGFSDVRNHLNSAALLDLMGTDLFVFHGWTATLLGDEWKKGSPAFNTELCRRFAVPPLEFDGTRDALLHAADGEGRRHMEYVRERGTYLDLPFDNVMTTLVETYGPAMVRSRGDDVQEDPAFRP